MDHSSLPVGRAFRNTSNRNRIRSGNPLICRIVELYKNQGPYCHLPARPPSIGLAHIGAFVFFRVCIFKWRRALDPDLTQSIHILAPYLCRWKKFTGSHSVHAHASLLKQRPNAPKPQALAVRVLQSIITAKHRHS